MALPRSAATRRPPLLVGLTIAALALAMAGCIVSRGVRVRPLAPGTADSATVRSPVKAHLTDGSTVVYERGVTVARGAIRGVGWRYDLTLANRTAVTDVPLDSVVGMETFQTDVSVGKSILYSTLSTVGVVGGTVALICASDPKCFGSCPTIYADSAGTPVLEAEGFSGSISPLLEARDVDRIRTRADARGTLRLEVWNEALETHFINHLELLEVRHAADEVVVPDERGRPVAVAGELPVGAAADRLGRDLRATLARADGDVFSSDPRLLERATATDLLDHIDVTVPVPRGAGDSAAVVLRLRSSLLNTLVFYDFMLAKPGARSLDWLADDMTRLDRVAELARWYGQYFGIRVAVRDSAGDWRPAARLADYGPIAWRDVAVVVPVPAGADSLRLRLSFLADQWRIDRLAVAGRVRRATPRAIPVASIAARDGALQPDAADAVQHADEHYLRTSPRQRFTVAFDAGVRADSAAAPATASRTFLLASQGYYTEWVRGAWLAGARDTTTFTPSAGTLVRAMHDWRAQRDSMERQFFRSRIPVD
jgi:hypothetical protein